MDQERRDSVNPYQVTAACERAPSAPIASRTRSSTLAIVSLAFGISSVGGLLSCALLILLAPAAVITGHLAHKQIREDPTLTGKGMATAGLITGYVGVALLALLTIVAVVAAADLYRR